jgi:hypothetical protein
MSWAAQELKTANLGDKRRNQRLIKIVEDLSTMLNASVTQAARDEAAVQGIYEFWGNVRVEPSEILAAHRDSTLSRVETEESLQQAIAQTAACGELTLELQRTPKRKPRTATLTVRISSLELQPPQQHPQRSNLKPVSVQVVWAIEQQPPGGEKAIAWLLLTTLEVTNFEQAERCLRWYSYRWLIERYHYTLKSGCRLEQLQLETADRLERALASPSLAACVRWIARLGGFLGRKNDGEPGVKTLWLGLQRVHDMASIWQLLAPGNQ